MSGCLCIYCILLQADKPWKQPGSTSTAVLFSLLSHQLDEFLIPSPVSTSWYKLNGQYITIVIPPSRENSRDGGCSAWLDDSH